MRGGRCTRGFGGFSMSEPDAKLVNSNSASPKSSFDVGIDFLLAEFSSIRGFKEQSVSISDKRVDVFLTVASALVAALGLLSQTNIDVQSYLFIVLFGA